MIKRRIFLPLILILVLLASCYSPLVKTSVMTSEEITLNENTAQFHFLDVGQGDCILIRDFTTTILIDAGTTQSGPDICDYLKNLDIDYIDCFIGTHPHEDHIGGASAVLSSFDVGDVFLNGYVSESYAFERLVDTMISEKITPYFPDINSPYNYGKFTVEFFSPVEDFGDGNNNSLLSKIRYGNISALMTGDCERPVESYLIKNNIDIRSDILKVGHHGSRYASSNDFLNIVSPDVAVIQCGKDNSYGHPHQEALERISGHFAQILRTDTRGTIVLNTDGTKIYASDGTEYINTQKSVKTEILFIANKKSKIFHVETCPNLPSESNRIILSSREDAEKQGYKPCGNCFP